MQKTRLILMATLCLMWPLCTFAQTKEIYTNPGFSALSRTEKTLAILPFTASINLRPRQRAKVTEAQLTEMEKQSGLEVQNALQTYFLKRKAKKSFTVEFQDIQLTNALLKKHGVSTDSLRFLTPQQLAELLGVDGVIGGDLQTDKPMSEGASIALGVLVGFYGATNSGKCVIHIHDGKTGKLMWKYDKTLSRSLGSDINTIITSIMRKAARKFPYDS
jgi:hypothetical protein